MHRRAILNTNIQRFFKNKIIKVSTANNILYLLDFIILYFEDKFIQDLIIEVVVTSIAYSYSQDSLLSCIQSPEYIVNLKILQGRE